LPATYTGGNHYEVILYNENITVNNEFQNRFVQHCDSIQLTNSNDSIVTADIDLENDNNYNKQPCVINESNLCDDDNLESDKQFYEEFALAVFGRVIKQSLDIEGDET